MPEGTFSSDYLALVQRVRESTDGQDSRQKIVDVLKKRNDYESENFTGAWGPYSSPAVLATKKEVITETASLFNGARPTGYSAPPYNTTISEEVSRNSELATTSGAIAEFLGDIDEMLTSMLSSDKITKFKKSCVDAGLLANSESKFVSL